MTRIHRYASPLGPVTLASDGRTLTGLWFDGQRHFGAGLSPEPEECSLPVFGEAVRSGSLHKGRGLDKLIGKWEHALSPAEEEAVFDGVAALIREQKAERVVLAGTVAQADLEPVVEALRTRLEGAEIAGAAGLPENAEGLAEALRAPAVILVEKRNGSKVADIRREAEMLAIGQAAVAGAVVI